MTDKKLFESVRSNSLKYMDTSVTYFIETKHPGDKLTIKIRTETTGENRSIRPNLCKLLSIMKMYPSVKMNNGILVSVNFSKECHVDWHCKANGDIIFRPSRCSFIPREINDSVLRIFISLFENEVDISKISEAAFSAIFGGFEGVMLLYLRDVFFRTKPNLWLRNFCYTSFGFYRFERESKHKKQPTTQYYPSNVSEMKRRENGTINLNEVADHIISLINSMIPITDNHRNHLVCSLLCGSWLGELAN